MDKVELLERYVAVNHQIKDLLYRQHKGQLLTDEITALVVELESDVNRAKQYMLEDALSDYATYDEISEQVVINKQALDQQVNLIREPTGELVFRFPVWLLRSSSKKWNIRPNHRGLPYIRASQFWGALIRKYFTYDDGYCGSPARPILNPRRDADVTLIFKQCSRSLADWDKYDVSYLINALVYNGIIPGDHPSELNLQYSFRLVEQIHDECIEARIKNR